MNEKEFPYVVERMMAAVYRVSPVEFVDDISKRRFKNSFVIEFADPKKEGSLIPEAKDILVKVVSEFCKQNSRRVCVVLGPRECVYCEPDGTKKNSEEIPEGGMEL